MHHLKYSSMGTNLWAVERARGEQRIKVAEIALTQQNEFRLIPVAFAFSLAELEAIAAFMHASRPAIVPDPPTVSALIAAIVEEDEMERARR